MEGESKWVGTRLDLARARSEDMRTRGGGMWELYSDARRRRLNALNYTAINAEYKRWQAAEVPEIEWLLE